MNDRLLRRSEDQIRFVSAPSYDESIDMKTVDDIRLMRKAELIYLYLLVFFDLVAKIVCAIIVIFSPDAKIKWIIVAYAMCSYNFFMMTFNLGYFLILSKHARAHRHKAIYRALYCFSYALIAMGLGLYFENKIKTFGLYAFAIPYVIFSTAIFVVEAIRGKSYSFVAIYGILESVQLLLIYINISFDKNYDWTYTLLIYYLIAIAYFVAAIISFLAFIIIFINNCVSASDANDNPGNYKQATGTLVFDILFYVIWNGYVYFKLIGGFDVLLTENKLGPMWDGSVINETLMTGFVILGVCSVISILLWIVSMLTKTELLREVLYWIR